MYKCTVSLTLYIDKRNILIYYKRKFYKLINILGTQSIINTLGTQSIINTLGTQSIINTLGT